MVFLVLGMLFIGLIYVSTGSIEKYKLGEGEEYGEADPSYDGDPASITRRPQVPTQEPVWDKESGGWRSTPEWKPDLDKY